MATIRFRRGTTDPTASIQSTGLTMGEPVFNRELNKFWIGGSGPAGFTGIWVGAEIENSVNWNSPSEFKLATQAAIASRINTIVGASAGVQTIEGLSGTIDLVFGTGISGSTSSGTITFQNTGVVSLGLSGDWKTRGVTNFGGPVTGGITLGAETWQGSATFALNSNGTTDTNRFGGITNGTILTGKSAMEILELILVDYLTPTVTLSNMGNCAGVGYYSRTILPFGVSGDADQNSTITWSTTNPQNLVGGLTLSVTATQVLGLPTSGTLLSPAQITSSTAGSYSGFTYHYKGITQNGSGVSRVTYSVIGRNSRGSNTTASTINIEWYPRIYAGWTTDAGLTYPPDSWKSIGVLRSSGMTSGALMTSSSTTTPNHTLSVEAPSTPNSYLYFWIDAYFSPTLIKDTTPSGFDFGVVGPTTITGLTLDDGVSTKTYKRYRSTEQLNSAQTVIIGA